MTATLFAGVRGTDSAAVVRRVSAESAFPRAATNTSGANIILSGGIGRRLFTVVDYTLGVGDTISVREDGVTTTLTEGVAFSAVTSNTVTATNIAAAINASVAIAATALAVGAIVYVLKASSTARLNILTSDATAWTVTEGTDGVVHAPGNDLNSLQIGQGSVGGLASTVIGVNASVSGVLTNNGCTAIGRAALASDRSTAVGTGASAISSGAGVAFGHGAIAGFNGTALGVNANANATFAIAIGTSSTSGRGQAIGVFSTTTTGTAIGESCTSTSGISIGGSAVSAGPGIAIGASSVTGGSNTWFGIALGNSSTSSASNSATIAIGQSASCTGLSHAIAIGYLSSVSGSAAIGIGPSCSVTHANSVAIGTSATSTAANQFVVGANASPVRLFYFGQGVSGASALLDVEIHSTRKDTTETDESGANLVFASGEGTGAATVSTITLRTPTATASGMTQQALATRMTIAESAITSTTHLLFSADNTLDIGATGATRPRRVYVGTEVVVGATVTIGAAAITGSGAMSVTATGANLTLAATGANNVAIHTNGSARLTIADAVATLADAVDVAVGTTTGSKIGTTSTQKLGWWGTVPVVRSSSAALVNNVTAGGTADTIDNYTDLAVYANDAATIRNDIYQLAQKVQEISNALRLYGILG